MPSLFADARCDAVGVLGKCNRLLTSLATDWGTIRVTPSRWLLPPTAIDAVPPCRRRPSCAVACLLRCGGLVMSFHVNSNQRSTRGSMLSDDVRSSDMQPLLQASSKRGVPREEPRAPRMRWVGLPSMEDTVWFRFIFAPARKRWFPLQLLTCTGWIGKRRHRSITLSASNRI